MPDQHRHCCTTNHNTNALLCAGISCVLDLEQTATLGSYNQFKRSCCTAHKKTALYRCPEVTQHHPNHKHTTSTNQHRPQPCIPTLNMTECSPIPVWFSGPKTFPQQLPTVNFQPSTASHQLSTNKCPRSTDKGGRPLSQPTHTHTRLTLPFPHPSTDKAPGLTPSRQQKIPQGCHLHNRPPHNRVSCASHWQDCAFGHRQLRWLSVLCVAVQR
jgi:hypothetical protein